MDKTGRELFKKYKRFINVIEKMFNIMPQSILNIFWNSTTNFDSKLAITLRYLIVKSQAAYCGDNVRIGPRVSIKNIHNLSIGNNVSIHENCYLDAKGGITIGNNVSIAHQSSLLSFDHSWEDITKPIKYNEIKIKPIIIKDDVWIGCSVKILKGVLINSRSIIAAGAVVVKDIEERTLVGGIPAKVLKSI